MQNQTSGKMIRAYQTLVDRLKEYGIKPKLHILDYECSNEFKEQIETNNMKYQLVPPHDHMRNIAEKSVQTFKDYSVAVLCRTNAKFPLQLWCRILRQAEHQLNLLRKSRVVPNISAFACLYGQHDYNTNPFAPRGTAVEMHVTPANRKTYETHTKTGFYVGNSWEHYRYHKIWIADTRSVRVGETVFSKHKYLTRPAVTMSDAILRAGDDL